MASLASPGPPGPKVGVEPGHPWGNNCTFSSEEEGRQAEVNMECHTALSPTAANE